MKGRGGTGTRRRVHGARARGSGLLQRWKDLENTLGAAAGAGDLGLVYGLVGFPCSPRDFQESSPTPQFKSINSLVLSFLHSLTRTFILSLYKNGWSENSRLLDIVEDG